MRQPPDFEKRWPPGAGLFLAIVWFDWIGVSGLDMVITMVHRAVTHNEPAKGRAESASSD